MSKRNDRKKRVLFVGAFATNKSDGRTGGQLFACNSLVNSSLAEEIDWIKIDTTAAPPFPNIAIRSAKAIFRILKIIHHLLFSRLDAVLIFSSYGMSFLEKGLMALLASWRGKKVLFAPRSGKLAEWIEQNKRLHAFAKKVFGASNVIICQGEYWKETYQALFPSLASTKFEVVPNWLDAHTIRMQVEAAKINKEDDKIDALFLGWVSRTKGVFELIEAAALLEESHQNINYHICGYGDDFDEANKYVDEKGLADRITFHGWTKGVAKYEMLKRADMFVLPTHFEGFPNALLEAMAAGIPSIVTRVGAVGEVLEDGVNGIEIPVLDPPALSRAIARLADDEVLRAQLGNAAMETIVRRFTIEPAVEKFREII